MNSTKIISSILFLFTGLFGLVAQESTNTTGGEASGTGGTTSYSVGQIAYTTITETNGTVQLGVQQSYEIFSISGIDKSPILLEISIYPNPTKDFLVLKVEEYTNLNYQLINMRGKVIESKTINTNSTVVDLETLPKATYFLKVNNKAISMRTFKIIKN